jgi:hypothetical protein
MGDFFERKGAVASQIKESLTAHVRSVGWYFPYRHTDPVKQGRGSVYAVGCQERTKVDKMLTITI